MPASASAPMHGVAVGRHPQAGSSAAHVQRCAARARFAGSPDTGSTRAAAGSSAPAEGSGSGLVAFACSRSSTESHGPGSPFAHVRVASCPGSGGGTGAGTSVRVASAKINACDSGAPSQAQDHGGAQNASRAVSIYVATSRSTVVVLRIHPGSRAGWVQDRSIVEIGQPRAGFVPQANAGSPVARECLANEPGSWQIECEEAA